jgi:8-oxo-dGTP pyrophosphatase MutT (NUDIX family)
LETFVADLHHLLNPIEDKFPGDFNASTAAAVMILLLKMNGDWNILYTRRTQTVKTHQGEVSFPGGSFEQGDHSLWQTALRETREEIGASDNCIEFLGSMNPTKTITNFLVYPFVGLLNCASEFVMNPDEVERIFTIPVQWLKDPKNFYEEDFLLYGKETRRVLHYKLFDGEHLWGLTARITQELLNKIS